MSRYAMNTFFTTEWADEARLTFNRMPVPVQADLIGQLPRLVAKYAELYRRRTVDSQVVGTVSHMQAPDWGMWLRLDTDYWEEDGKPVLRISELTELPKTELEPSLQAAYTMPGRINPPLV